MNATAQSVPLSQRGRAFVAALIAFVMAAAGVLVATPASAATTAVSGSITSASEAGLGVTIDFTGVDEIPTGKTGVYVALTESGTTNVVFPGQYIPTALITGGAGSGSYTAPAASLDRSKSYEALVWFAHGNPTADVIVGRQAVAISAEQWAAVFGSEDDDGSGDDEGGAGEDGGGSEGEEGEGSEGEGEGSEGEGEGSGGGENEAATWTPALTVEFADGAELAAGDTVYKDDVLVIKGTGFDPLSHPLAAGGRPPITVGDPTGNYVVFGNFAQTWQPSVAGTSSADRVVAAQRWALTDATFENIDARYINAVRGQRVVLTEDGTFEFEITAAAIGADKTAPADGSYGVFTYVAGGGENDPAQELELRLDYVDSPRPVSWTPALTVEFADGAELAAGDTVYKDDVLVIKGTGFDPLSHPLAAGGRPPITVGDPTGNYVVFGNFAQTWQPSVAGTSSADRVVAAQRWALTDATFENIDARYINAVRGQRVVLTEDGTFEFEITAAAIGADKTAPADGSYGVFTYVAGGGENDPAQELELRLDYVDSPRPTTGPTVDVSVTSASAADGAAIRVVGSGFDGITGAYAAIIEKGSESSVGMDGGYAAFGYWMVPGIFVNGAFDQTLVAPAANLDPEKDYEFLVWQGHVAPNADTIYARGDVPFTEAHWKLLFPGTTPEPKPEEPTTPTTPTVPGGSLRWAISSSFVNYITGDIAQGQITVSGGATRSGGQFQFGQASGSTFNPETGIGAVSYVGAVRFTGHHGVLDVTIRNPRIVITSASSAVLYVTSGGSQVAFATLNLSAGTKTTNNGAVTFTAVPATLTSAGQNQVFAGYGTSLNPLTFTIGAASSAPAGSSGTVAGAAQEPEKAEIPSTPPAETGIDVTDEDLASFTAGGVGTFSAPGFQPNEENIQVVVYSTPVLLDTVTADASGVATWTGAVPATLADGEHTLTFQGSVNRGLVFALDRGVAATVFGQCIAEGATLNWGFKETFRVYIEGIAHGGWDLTDIEYEFPDYVWTGGSGSLDAEALTGLVAFGGTLAFHGHDGALDTKLNNARIELAGEKGYLVFDITGTTQGGDDIDAKDVRFAEFSLAGVELADGAITIDAAAATLTDAGAEAFGTYPAGEELDPVSAVIPVDADCGVVVAEPIAEEETPAEPEETDAASAPVWPWIAGGALLALLLGIGIGVLVSRGRKGAASETASE